MPINKKYKIIHGHQSIFHGISPTHMSLIYNIQLRKNTVHNFYIDLPIITNKKRLYTDIIKNKM